jgi:hypothetical protein
MTVSESDVLIVKSAALLDASTALIRKTKALLSSSRRAIAETRLRLNAKSEPSPGPFQWFSSADSGETLRKSGAGIHSPKFG